MTQNADSQSSMTPEQALELLSEGNARFRASRRSDRDAKHDVKETAGGQWPFAVVLSCIDSRVSSELVFDLGIGDVFSARIAGNFVNEDLLGSIEFGCKVAGSKLVVVMGHTHCGAIKGACDDVQLGNLTSMLGKLKPAVAAVSEPAAADQRTSGNPAFVQAVAEKNVELTLDTLRERSPVLRELEDEGSIRIVGAMYDVESGAVEFWE